MKNRIKAIRKHFNLTQTQFGERIGVKGNTVTTYESGDRTPSVAVIDLICREFGVNEMWLIYGDGEMLYKPTIDEQLAAFFGATLAADDASIHKQFTIALSKTTAEELQIIREFATRLLNCGTPEEKPPQD